MTSTNPTAAPVAARKPPTAACYFDDPESGLHTVQKLLKISLLITARGVAIEDDDLDTLSWVVSFAGDILDDCSEMCETQFFHPEKLKIAAEQKRGAVERN